MHFENFGIILKFKTYLNINRNTERNLLGKMIKKQKPY